jgi:ABC-type branched-subunit amino acid transport system substrate-binding protein
MPAMPIRVTRFLGDGPFCASRFPHAWADALRAAAAALGLSLLAACAAAPGPDASASGVAIARTGGTINPARGPRVDPARPAVVALLAPLSSPEPRAQAQARDLEAAARLAASELGALVELRVFDDGADPAKAQQAARAAVEGGASIIIGPLFSAQAAAVRAVAEETATPVLSFSSDSGAGGPPVWVMGDLPENEVERVLAYAASNGMRSVAVIRPQNDYGALVERAASGRAPRHNVAVLGSLTYPRSAEGVQDVVGQGAAAVKAAAPRAALIADGGPALRLVASYLAYGDVVQPQTQYLGLGLWDDDPEIARESALQGAWFAAADPAAGQGFASRFEAAAGRAPGPVAGFAYDAVTAIGALLRDARAVGVEHPFSAEAITRPQGFPGSRGAFRFRADGGNERALAVFEVQQAGFLVRDPAPVAFGPGA